MFGLSFLTPKLIVATVIVLAVLGGAWWLHHSGYIAAEQADKAEAAKAETETLDNISKGASDAQKTIAGDDADDDAARGWLRKRETGGQ